MVFYDPKFVLTSNAHKIFDALGGETGLRKLNAHKIKNRGQGVYFCFGDTKLDDAKQIVIEPYHHRWLVRLTTRECVHEWSLPLEVLKETIWGFLIRHSQVNPSNEK